jgi:hypothetical protein
MTNYQLNKIEKLREKIHNNQQIQDQLYREIIQEIGLKQYSLAEEFLFDAVFNSPDEKDYEYFLQKCQDRVKLEN